MKLTKIKSLVAAVVSLVSVGLSAFAAEPEAVQLWEGGPYFATCNIGANAPQEYGYYFWWGDTVGYTNNGSAWVSVADGTTTIEFSGTDPTATNTYKKTNAELKSLGYIDDDANPVLNAAHDAAKVKLGDSWRMMTKVELDALTNTAYCTSAWTDNWNNTGVKGYIVTGNTSGYTDKSIFLPATGYGNGAKITNPSVVGCYWSSTPDLDNSNPELRLQYALNISFMSGAFRASGLARYRGGVVRAVRDTPLVTDPTVKVASVETGDPWSTITVNYTLGGTDATLDYKVAFDITAGGQTASVTNDAAKVENKGYSQEIDTAALFGAATPDTKAKVKVSLIALKPKAAGGVQLWEGGPYWAECNIGATKPEDYGILTNFNDAAQAVTDALGNGWRLPTKAEFEALLANCGKGTWTEQNGAKGRLFTGTGDYSSNSIFLPAAGYDEGAGRKWAEYYGRYWSSEEYGVDLAWYLNFYDCDAPLYNYDRSWGFSVRAVRASGEDEIVVAWAEMEFVLTAFRELPENPTAEDVRAAIEASGAKDKNRLLALIGGASDPVAAYQEFVAWAQGVGDVAVLNSDHAGDSFAFGVEELFENEPEVQISDVAVGTGAPGAMDIAVMVKDGDSPKRVSSEKVAQMFEATTDIADWTGGRIEVSVTDRTGKVATPVEFTVTPGDGTAEKAFLRIRK